MFFCFYVLHTLFLAGRCSVLFVLQFTTGLPSLQHLLQSLHPQESWGLEGLEAILRSILNLQHDVASSLQVIKMSSTWGRVAVCGMFFSTSCIPQQLHLMLLHWPFLIIHHRSLIINLHPAWYCFINASQQADANMQFLACFSTYCDIFPWCCFILIHHHTPIIHHYPSSPITMQPQSFISICIMMLLHQCKSPKCCKYNLVQHSQHLAASWHDAASFIFILHHLTITHRHPASCISNPPASSSPKARTHQSPNV